MTPDIADPIEISKDLGGLIVYSSLVMRKLRNKWVL